MGCPVCFSENISTVSETESHTKGYGCCKGGIGAILFGPIGWLCGLIGMGKGKTTTRVYRVCNSCGERFR